MATIRLPTDFKEFLKLLNAHGVDYLIVGGFAVGFHGYPRSTGVLDVWVAMNGENAARLTAVLKEFGFSDSGISAGMFLEPKALIRMGHPPLRIEVLTTISGVEFAEAYASRITATIDGVTVNVLSVEDLKANKRAAGRHKDLSDLENLP